MKRALREGLALCCLLWALSATGQGAGAPPVKTLRLAFPADVSGFDPAQAGDNYSFSVTAQIFDGLYGFDELARPSKLRPVTALGMPEVSADFRTWTVRLKPGTLFADDPTFNGRKRELVAQDLVFSLKRFADPALKSPMWGNVEQMGISGLTAERERALKTKRPFDYDREVAGLRALDRHTLQLRLDAPRPRLLQSLIGFTTGAVAREVVERYGDRIMEHPVGTGPFRLAQWRRSSLIVLERNPNYREEFYDAEPAADDAEGQAWLRKFKGRRLPMVNRVQISIVEASQPLWLSFLNGSFDQLTVPAEFVKLAMPGGKLAPYLETQGMRGHLVLGQAVSFTYFNMEHPLVGGYTPDKVALRRALALAMDIERQILILRGGQALAAQSPIGAHLSGYDPAFRSEMGEYSPARAKALLDMYGYVDRDGDGWRDQPDGRPLVLKMGSQADAVSRQHDELMKRDMDAIRVRIVFNVAQWPENVKAARAGKLMMWSMGWGAIAPDGQVALQRLYSPSAGEFNMSRFKLPEMDALYESLLALPDGPERDALFDQAKRLAVAYMPEKTTVHRMFTELTQPWLEGYRPRVFGGDWYHRVDIDTARLPTH